VSLDAVFRRVRLGGPEPDVAYYTTITIAGHVFRGVLYDVGPHSGSTAASDTDGSAEEVGSSLTTAGGSCLDLSLGM
jgi:LRP1 type putative zinc finger protein